MGRDGIGMTTQDADPGGPSSLMDSLSGPPQAAELALDAYGLPIQDVPPAGRRYRPSHASRSGIVSTGLAITGLVMLRNRVVLALLCGVVSVSLGITDVVAYNILPGYVAFPGMAIGWLALGLRRKAEKKMTGSETRGRRIALRTAGALGMLGFLLLVVGTGHGDALNNAS